MYAPPHFEVSDLAGLHALVERHPFATLVSTVAGEPFATHLPLLLDRAAGPQGSLTGHVARANPHWRAFDGETPALAIFHGPHAYVSPSWYAQGPAVPTWNYAAVHVYGRPLAFEDPAHLEPLVDRMVATFEAGQASPWSGALPEAFKAGMLRAIVGLRLEIGRIEGKWKLGQNRSRADQEGVLRALEASGSPEDAGLAAFTRARMPPRGSG
jgi:transcriptional regulator